MTWAPRAGEDHTPPDGHWESRPHFQMQLFNLVLTKAYIPEWGDKDKYVIA